MVTPTHAVDSMQGKFSPQLLPHAGHFFSFLNIFLGSEPDLDLDSGPCIQTEISLKR